MVNKKEKPKKAASLEEQKILDRIKEIEELQRQHEAKKKLKSDHS